MSSGPLLLGLPWNTLLLTPTHLLPALTLLSVTYTIFLLNQLWKDYAFILFTCLTSLSQLLSNPTFLGFVLNLNPSTQTSTPSIHPNLSTAPLLGAPNCMARLPKEKGLSQKVTYSLLSDQPHTMPHM